MLHRHIARAKGSVSLRQVHSRIERPVPDAYAGILTFCRQQHKRKVLWKTDPVTRNVGLAICILSQMQHEPFNPCAEILGKLVHLVKYETVIS